jgi:hypothetical protein
LIGALSYARDWAVGHPDRRTVVVFITDGDANRCSPIDASAIALQASSSLQAHPKIPVHFIGIDGSYGLDPVAEAAGTRDVSEIAIRGSVNETVDDFVRILENIAEPWQPCEFDVPEGWVDLGPPELNYETGAGAVYDVELLNGAGECDTSMSGGFFFSGWDVSSQPSRVTLCPCTCSEVQGSSVSLTTHCGF